MAGSNDLFVLGLDVPASQARIEGQLKGILNSIDGKVKVSADTSNLSKQIQGALKNNKVKVSIDTSGGSGLNAYNAQMKQFASSALAAQTSATSFGTSLKSAFASGVGLTSSYKMVLATINALKSGINTVAELDKYMTNIRTVTGGSMDSVRSLTNEYNKLAQQMHATTSEVLQSADTFLRQGRTLKDTNELIRTSTILSKTADS